MIKRIGAYSIREGADKDAFWKYHTQVHAVHCAEVWRGPSPKKYVINRVLETAYGKPPFYGMTDQVTDTEEEMNNNSAALKAAKLPNGKTVFDDFDTQEALVNRFGLTAEEYVVKGAGLKVYATSDNKVIKRVFTTSLTEGTDEDEFWKYWTEQHAPDIVKASSPGLLKYVLSRVTKMLSGERPFFALMEMWYENEEAMNKDFKAWKTLKLPSGESIFDDFENRVTGSWAATVEEHVAKDIMP